MLRYRSCRRCWVSSIMKFADKLAMIFESYEGLEDADEFGDEPDWMYVLRQVDEQLSRHSPHLKPNILYVPDDVIIFGDDETLKFIKSINQNRDSVYTSLSEFLEILTTEAVYPHQIHAPGDMDFVVMDSTTAGDDFDIINSLRDYMSLVR